MTLSDVLYFHISTEAPVAANLDWRSDYASFPAVVSIAWVFKGAKHFALACQEGLNAFLDDCYAAPLLCGYNLHASVSAIKAQVLKWYGQEYYEEMAVGEALHKRKRIDIMLRSKCWTEARSADGRLRFPRLEDIYTRCFPGERRSAGSPPEAVELLRLVLPRLVLEGLVELKEREYAENARISQI